MRIAAELVAVRDLAEFLRAACQREGLSDGDMADLELALVEAANNVVEHGHPAGESGEITLDLYFGPTTTELVLSDCGRPARPDLFEDLADMPLDALAGRGVGIIQACVDRIEYASADGRNRLSLVKQRS